MELFQFKAYIFKIIFPNKYHKVGKYLNFPVGNMFWARADAVYQIFDII